MREERRRVTTDPLAIRLEMTQIWVIAMRRHGDHTRGWGVIGRPWSPRSRIGHGLLTQHRPHGHARDENSSTVGVDRAGL